MKTVINICINGITTKVIDTHKFNNFNWENFEEGDNIFFPDDYFATFISYEVVTAINANIVTLEIKNHSH